MYPKALVQYVARPLGSIFKREAMDLQYGVVSPVTAVLACFGADQPERRRFCGNAADIWHQPTGPPRATSPDGGPPDAAS